MPIFGSTTAACLRQASLRPRQRACAPGHAPTSLPTAAQRLQQVQLGTYTPRTLAAGITPAHAGSTAAASTATPYPARLAASTPGWQHGVQAVSVGLLAAAAVGGAYVIFMRATNNSHRRHVQYMLKTKSGQDLEAELRVDDQEKTNILRDQFVFFGAAAALYTILRCCQHTPLAQTPVGPALVNAASVVCVAVGVWFYGVGAAALFAAWRARRLMAALRHAAAEEERAAARSAVPQAGRP